MIRVTKRVQFSHVHVFSDSRNVRKRATKSDTSGHCLVTSTFAGGHAPRERGRGYPRWTSIRGTDGAPRALRAACRCPLKPSPFYLPSGALSCAALHQPTGSRLPPQPPIIPGFLHRVLAGGSEAQSGSRGPRRRLRKPAVSLPRIPIIQPSPPPPFTQPHPAAGLTLSNSPPPRSCRSRLSGPPPQLAHLPPTVRTRNLSPSHRPNPQSLSSISVSPPSCPCFHARSRAAR